METKIKGGQADFTPRGRGREEAFPLFFHQQNIRTQGKHLCIGVLPYLCRSDFICSVIKSAMLRPGSSSSPASGPTSPSDTARSATALLTASFDFATPFPNSRGDLRLSTGGNHVRKHKSLYTDKTALIDISHTQTLYKPQVVPRNWTAFHSFRILNSIQTKVRK